MPPSIFLSIIIPAYNEERRIGPTLEAVSQYLKDKNFSCELMVVDDGSTDETVSEVKKYAQLFKNFIILENKENKGKGYSVKRGMLSATGQYRLFMDADHSVKIDNLEAFLKYIDEGADIVIASIELPGSSIQDYNYGYRRIFGKLSKILIRAVATPGIYDTQRGFKLFTREAAEAVFPLQTIERWGFDIELAVIAQKKGLKIKELPVDWANSKASSVLVSSYFETLIELMRIKLNSWKSTYR